MIACTDEEEQTLEMTKLQVGGSDAMTIKLVCSTVSEIEHLLPWLVECKAQGKHVDVWHALRDSSCSFLNLTTWIGPLRPSCCALSGCSTREGGIGFGRRYIRRFC